MEVVQSGLSLEDQPASALDLAVVALNQMCTRKKAFHVIRQKLLTHQAPALLASCHLKKSRSKLLLVQSCAGLQLRQSMSGSLQVTLRIVQVAMCMHASIGRAHLLAVRSPEAAADLFTLVVAHFAQGSHVRLESVLFDLAFPACL